MKRIWLLFLPIVTTLILVACGTKTTALPTKFALTDGVNGNTAILDSDNHFHVKGTAPAKIKYVGIIENGAVNNVVEVNQGRFEYEDMVVDGPRTLTLYGATKEPEIDSNKSTNGLTYKLTLVVPAAQEDDTDTDWTDEPDETPDEYDEDDDQDTIWDQPDQNDAEDTDSQPTFNEKDYSTSITFDQIARTPDDYEGKLLALTGKVLQVIEGDEDNNLRVAVNGDYDDVIYIVYDQEIMAGTRILEDDKVTIYGESENTTTYQSTLGGNITVPLIYADKIVDSGKAPDNYGY